MANYDRRSTELQSVFDGGKCFVLENTVSTVIAASADTIEALTIPNGYYVGNVFLTIVTQSDAGTSYTVAVGDASASDGWDASSNMKAAAGTITQGAAGTDAYLPTNKGTHPHFAKAYASGGKIILTGTLGGTVPTVGSVKVQALCYKPLVGSY